MYIFLFSVFFVLPLALVFYDALMGRLWKKRTNSSQPLQARQELVASSQKQIQQTEPTKLPEEQRDEKERLHSDYLQKDAWISNQTLQLNGALSVIELVRTLDINEIGYSDLLKCVEWQFKRLRVLVRDGFKCKTCGLISDYNHVHHTYYLKDSLPWEIDESALQTQCGLCHKRIHDRTIIKVFKQIENRLIETNNNDIYCSRCHGSGYFPEYDHIQGGICFRCHGNCIDKTIFTNRLTIIRRNGNDVSPLPRSDYQFYLNNINISTFIEKIKPSITTSHEPIDDLPF